MLILEISDVSHVQSASPSTIQNNMDDCFQENAVKIFEKPSAGCYQTFPGVILNPFCQGKRMRDKRLFIVFLKVLLLFLLFLCME